MHCDVTLACKQLRCRPVYATPLPAPGRRGTLRQDDAWQYAWRADGGGVNGCCLVDALLLSHALKLLSLQLVRGLVSKKSLRSGASALQFLRQAAFLANKLLNDLVRQAVSGRGFRNKDVLHLLRAHHIASVRRIFVHCPLH